MSCANIFFRIPTKNVHVYLFCDHCIETKWGRRGHDCMVVGFTTTYARMPITADVVSLNPAQCKMYNIM